MLLAGCGGSRTVGVTGPSRAGSHVAVDAIVFTRPVPARLRRVLDATAARADYAALLGGVPVGGPGIAADRAARGELGSLSPIRLAPGTGAAILWADWRDRGLAITLGEPADARVVRLRPPLPAGAIPIARFARTG